MSYNGMFNNTKIERVKIKNLVTQKDYVATTKANNDLLFRQLYFLKNENFDHGKTKKSTNL